MNKQEKCTVHALHHFVRIKLDTAFVKSQQW